MTVFLWEYCFKFLLKLRPPNIKRFVHLCIGKLFVGKSIINRLNKFFYVFLLRLCGLELRKRFSYIRWFKFV